MSEELKGEWSVISEPIMDRTLGLEKTVQTKQFHPLKFTSYVNNIPLEKWADEGFLKDLWKLMLTQTYHMLVIDHMLRLELGAIDDEEAYLLALEAELLERLNLDGISVNIGVNIDDEHVLDYRNGVEE